MRRRARDRVLRQLVRRLAALQGPRLRTPSQDARQSKRPPTEHWFPYALAPRSNAEPDDFDELNSEVRTFFLLTAQRTKRGPVQCAFDSWVGRRLRLPLTGLRVQAIPRRQVETTISVSAARWAGWPWCPSDSEVHWILGIPSRFLLVVVPYPRWVCKIESRPALQRANISELDAALRQNALLVGMLHFAHLGYGVGQLY